MKPRAFLPLILALSGLGGAALATSQLAGPPVIINETASMAQGAYVRTGDARRPGVGQIVALPLAGEASAYLHGRLGYPADTWLVKRVAGVAGDTICRNGTVVTVGGRIVEARSSDRAGNVLASWSGCQRLLRGEVFLLGDAATSFDGRYLGPTSITALTGTYREAVTW